MRRLFAVSLCAVFLATSVHSAPLPQVSWGKSGISLAQYRADALECGLKGHYTDVANTQDAKELVRASRRLDSLQNSFSPSTTGSSGTGPASTNVTDQMGQYAATQEHIIYSARPEMRFRNIKQTLESTTAECLVERGYSRFILTGDQRRVLRKLKPGSDERRAYLYGLASNPAVLQNQKATPPKP
jgi:hypothetical protein